MDIIKLIQERRSIRSFTKKSVPQKLIKTITDCGLAAPSSKNSNPWFIVTVRGKQKDQIAQWIEDGAKKRMITGPMNAGTGKLAKGAFDTTAESVQTIREASVLLLMFNRGSHSGGSKKVIENPRGGRSLYTYSGEIIGIGAAAQNMLLAATYLGLGTVFMADSYTGRMAVQKALKTKCELVGSIAIGYPAYKKPPRKLERSLVATWSKAIGKITRKNFTAKRT